MGADETHFGASPSRLDIELPFSDNNPITLITVGNVTDRKGQDIVIQAMPTVLTKLPQYTLFDCWIADKRNRNIYSWLKNLVLWKHVHFLGRVEKVQLVSYLRKSDIFVMTSRHTAAGDFEGYGIAVIEAALCGKPAVVSANSGLVEAVEDGSTGIVVPENDPVNTAQAIICLIQNPNSGLKWF